ncbi:hypothetical protein C1H46_044717 [Malus baccata]|uniref:KIB1-4 beta-propeller domain-containing protein n=1 Tax=Malus baccata TaxID=106549 RepID=A0A540K6B6_MALBA|nr:hypothetical protein C1H46_044717 [Malus baccata]
MGDLLLVDRHSDYNHKCKNAGHKFRIFKLEANEKKWVELGAEVLDDRILVMGDDGCYFVSSRDFPGCERRSMYFNKPWNEKSYKHELARMLSRFGVFSLDSGSNNILRLADLPSSENMFFPSPTWTWPANKPYSRKHNHGEDSRSTSEPTTKRRKIYVSL